MKHGIVDFKDRDEKVNVLKIAFGVCAMTISYQTADMINEILKKINEKDGECSIKDLSKIQVEVEAKWERYFAETEKP